MAEATICQNGVLYRAGNLIYRRANRADDKALNQLLRDNPMQGWLTLSLERKPTYFASENLIGKSRTIIALDASKDEQVVGMYRVAFMPMFVNGKYIQVGYLGELRVNKAYRNSLRILKYGFDSIHPLNQLESADTSVWFTSIASDNYSARRLLEAKNRSLPCYTPVGELLTLAISVRHSKQPMLLQPATKDDIPGICELHNRQMAKYNFATYLDPNWLSSLSATKGLGIEDFWVYKIGQGIQACIAIWDQRSFKQVVVQGYRFPLDRLRPLYNLGAYLLGKPLLPKKGSQLESVYLSFFSISPEAEKHAVNILQEALYISGLKKAKTGLLGLSDCDPLIPALRAALNPVVYKTCIETVDWANRKSAPLNSAPPQPEIAIL
ncbi:MAG: hypothetical protein KZQ82_09190 [Candidatus Thiodiazotropha sp. (ex Lucinoma annulata)]|nr:hypothetical protein [Candidatus Thiodiazotropha sp. (ex Lucinoma annulata)]